MWVQRLLEVGGKGLRAGVRRGFGSTARTSSAEISPELAAEIERQARLVGQRAEYRERKNLQAAVEVFDGLFPNGLCPVCSDTNSFKARANAIEKRKQQEHDFILALRGVWTEGGGLYASCGAVSAIGPSVFEMIYKAKKQDNQQAESTALSPSA